MRIRMIVILEKLTYNDCLEKDEKFFNFSFQSMNIMFLKNLSFPNANKLLDCYEYTLINENSFLNRIGFVELLYIEGFNLLLKNIAINNFEININLNNLEANFCSDSLKTFKIFLTNILKEIKLVKKLFKKKKDTKKIVSERKEIIPNNNTEIHIEADSIKNIDSILKSCYFNDNTIKNDAFSDEIDLEFDDYPNKNKDDDLKNNHKILMLSFSVNSLKINLFDGKDFSFIDNDGLSNNNSSLMNNSIKSGNSMKSDGIDAKFEIINDYITCQKTLKIENNSRKRNLRRNYENQINIILQNFDSKFNFDNLSNIPIKFTLEIIKAEIDDLIKDSKYKKMFSKYNYDNKIPVLKIKFEILNYSDLNPLFVFQDRQNLDISLNFELEPMNIQVDQNSLLFLLQVFKVNLNKNVQEEKESIIDEELNIENELNKKLLESINDKNTSSAIQITAIKVFLKEFFINISYNSHKLSFKQIKNKNYLELLNISNIKDLKIVFNKYSNSKCLDLFELIHELFNFWKEDIKKNQIVTAVFSSISYLRPFNNMFNGIIELVKQPYLAIKNHKNFKLGLAKGFANFFISLSSESIFLGEKFINLFSGLVGKEKKHHKRRSIYKNYLHLMNEKVRKHDNYFLK